MTRALIYVRVSSTGQELDGSSLVTQEALCRAYCAEHAYQVIGVFQDTHSGTEYRQRPGLSALREQVRAGIADVVVCYAVDRLSRNQAHIYIVAEEIEDHKARLEFVTEDFEDSAVGRFIRSARAFAAEVEHEKITERTQRGRLARVQSGRPLAGPKARYGYTWADEEKTALAIVPEQAAVVRRIYTEYAAGVTIRGIAQQLSDAGIPSPSGKPFWSRYTIRDILTNPNYTGEAYAFYPRDANGYVGDYDRDNAIRLPDGVYPAIIDQDMWHAARQRIRANQERASRNNQNPEATLLRGGIARCGICNRALVVNTRRDYGNSYYRCSGNNLLSGDTRRCQCNISARELDAIVWDRIVAYLLQPEIIRHETARHDNRDDAGMLAHIDRQLREVTARQRRTAEAIAILNDAESAAPLTDQLTALARQRRELEAERANTIASQAAIAAETLQIANLDGWRDRITGNLDSLTYQDRRDLLDLFRVSVRVYPTGHEPRYIINGIGPFAR